MIITFVVANVAIVVVGNSISWVAVDKIAGGRSPEALLKVSCPQLCIAKCASGESSKSESQSGPVVRSPPPNGTFIATVSI